MYFDPDCVGARPAPLRILLFLNGFEPGGVEKVALRLAAAWRESGATVHAVIGCDRGPLRQTAPTLTYEFLQPIGWNPRSLMAVHMVRRLPAIIRRVRPDVLFAAGNTYAIVGVLLKLLLGRACPPVVIKISNDLARDDMGPILRRCYRMWLRMQGRYLDHFVGMAEANRSEIATALGVADTRISIVRDPAVSRAQVEQLAKSVRPARDGGGRCFLAVGRLVRQKNFPLLVRAFADIAGSTDELIILGDGPERRRIERVAARLSVAKQVLLPGHGNPVAWLAKADMFILSSDYEGVPAVVIEAFAAGLPVIATRCSVAIPELLGEGQYGALVPRRDQAALAEAMRVGRIVPATEHDLRRQASRFTIDVGGPAYLAVFDRVAPHQRGLPVPERRKR